MKLKVTFFIQVARSWVISSIALQNISQSKYSFLAYVTDHGIEKLLTTLFSESNFKIVSSGLGRNIPIIKNVLMQAAKLDQVLLWFVKPVWLTEFVCDKGGPNWDMGLRASQRSGLDPDCASVFVHVYSQSMTELRRVYHFATIQVSLSASLKVSVSSYPPNFCISGFVSV